MSNVIPALIIAALTAVIVGFSGGPRWAVWGFAIACYCSVAFGNKE